MCTRPRRRRRRRRGACTQDAGAERGGRAAQRELMMVREQGKPSQTIARCRPWTPWNRFLDLPGRLEPFVDAASLSVFAPGVCRARSYQPRAARGRPADRVRERFGDFTLLECELLTGRTHQARPLRPLSPCVWKPFEPLCVETGSRCGNSSRVRRGGTGASGSEGPRAAAAACAEGAEPQIRVHLAHVGHPLAGDEKVTAPTALRVQRLQPPATPPPRTKWTRRVPHPVLIGHAASLTHGSNHLPRSTGPTTSDTHGSNHLPRSTGPTTSCAQRLQWPHRSARQYGGSVVARDLRARPAAPADTRMAQVASGATDAVLKRQALHAAQARAAARPAQPCEWLYTNPVRPTARPGIAARRLSRVCGRGTAAVALASALRRRPDLPRPACAGHARAASPPARTRRRALRCNPRRCRRTRCCWRGRGPRVTAGGHTSVLVRVL